MAASPFRSNQFPNKPANLISMPFHANLVSPCSVLVLITFAVSTGLPTQCASMISMPFHANLVSPCSVLVLITFAVSTGLPTQLVSAWTFHQCKDSQFNTGLDDIECASMISMPFHANLVSSLLSARADYFCSQHWTAHSVCVRMDISSVQRLTI